MLIQNFKNSTTEPNLEVKYTAYTRREFSAGGGVHVVADSEAPDLVLIGQVTSVVIPTLAFTLQGTLESRVTVRVDASVEDARTKKVRETTTSTSTTTTVAPPVGKPSRIVSLSPTATETLFAIGAGPQVDAAGIGRHAAVARAGVE